MGLDALLYVYAYIHFHTLCMRGTKARGHINKFVFHHLIKVLHLVLK